MSEQEKPVKYEDLPPRVRRCFDATCKNLGGELVLGNYRARRGAWVANVLTLDGYAGGDVVVLAEPEDGPGG